MPAMTTAGRPTVADFFPTNAVTRKMGNGDCPADIVSLPTTIECSVLGIVTFPADVECLPVAAVSLPAGIDCLVLTTETLPVSRKP